MGRLTIARIRDEAKPRDVAFRLPDGGGLHLFVTTTGVRSWRWRYEIGGREQTMVLGRYPDMSLADARLARDSARLALENPAPEPVKAPTFEEAARAWHTLNASRWKPHHAADVLTALELEAFPAFGDVPVNQVRPGMILAALHSMEARGAIDGSRRLKQRISRIFEFAAAQEWTQSDPTLGLRVLLTPLPPKGNRPALLDINAARQLIADLDAASGHPVTKLAMRFLALTAARPGMVNGMLWTEIVDLEWRLSAPRMKGGRAHIVPLVQVALDCLETVRPLTGRSRYPFPNAHNPGRPMSENALSAMLIRLGYQDRHCPHGWRATFSSVMNERYPADRQVIDLMLAHAPGNAVEAAYNRALHMERRRELAQLWADLLLRDAVPAAALLNGRRRA